MRTKLKFISVITMGQSPDQENVNQEGKGIPFLQGKAEFGDSYPTPVNYCTKANKFSMPNDILMSVRAPVGSLNLSDQKYAIGRGLSSITPNVNIDRDYLWYGLIEANTRLLTLVKGSTFDAVTTEDVKNLEIEMPLTFEEQQSISKFVSKKDKEISDLIVSKNKLIKLLEQQRQSIITEAVTKGLNPNVKMKDSGLEWIGEIPEHWDTKKIKHVASIFGRIGFRGYTVNDIVSEGEGAITLSPSNIQNGKLNLEKLTYLSWEKYYESPEIMIAENDVIFCKTGSSYGKAALVEKVDYPMTLNPQLIVIKVKKISSAYLSYIFQTPLIKNQVETIVAGGTMPTISQESLLSMKFVEPPLKEQEEIVEYLKEYNSEYDKILDSLSKQIQRLKEYRKALIYETLTGKIDVLI
jgi:type I restriction enzyme, S subunit